ncbi:hypothetical protein ABPG77_005831 [Micractinium sp. CCAP 211/92]
MNRTGTTESGTQVRGEEGGIRGPYERDSVTARRARPGGGGGGVAASAGGPMPQAFGGLTGGGDLAATSLAGMGGAGGGGSALGDTGFQSGSGVVGGAGDYAGNRYAGGREAEETGLQGTSGFGHASADAPSDMNRAHTTGLASGTDADCSRGIGNTGAQGAGSSAETAHFATEGKAGLYPAEEHVNPRLPLFPCSRYDGQDFVDDWMSRGQYFNLSNAGNYIYDKVVPSLIPGIVLGCLALLGFFTFLVWMFIGCCRCLLCCKCFRSESKDDAAARDQFIRGGAGGPAAQYGLTNPAKGARQGGCLTWGTAFWALFVGISLAVVGVSAWGMACSINLTDTTVSDFWALVDSAQGRVEDTISALTVLQQKSQNLTDASQVLTSNQPAVTAALQQVPGVTAEQADTLATTLAEVPSALAKAPDGLQSAVDFLTTTINQTITDIESDFKPPTMALQEQWRFIPIAVVFGLMILVVLLTLAAVWFMTWPKTTSFLVALLWFMVALLMLLGVGLLRGVYVMSDDACLFAESYVVAYARRKAGDSQWGQLVVYLVQYYIHANDGTDVTTPLAPGLDYAEALPPDAQQPLASIDSLIQQIGTGADSLAQIASSPVLQQALASRAPQLAGAMSEAGDAVAKLSYAVGNLTAIADRNNTDKLYHGVKEYICCSLANTAHDMWVAWTVVGCLGFVLAVMASGRVIAWAMGLRKRMKRSRASLPGGAVIWQTPPPMSGPPDSKAFAPSDAYEAPPEYKPPPVYAAPEQLPPPAVAAQPPAADVAPGNAELDTFVKHPHGRYAAVR